jgi:hypothetical protein
MVKRVVALVFFLLAASPVFCQNPQIPTYRLDLDFGYQHFAEMDEFMGMSILLNSRFGIMNSLYLLKAGDVFGGINLGVLANPVGTVEFPAALEVGYYFSRAVGLSLKAGYLLDLGLMYGTEQFIFSGLSFIFKKFHVDAGCSYCLNDYDYTFYRYRYSLRIMLGFALLAR